MDPDLARVIAHPLRHRLLFEYADRVTSPSKLAGKLGQPVNLVSYHTAVLRNAGCLELVRTKRRRGAEEHFYQAALLPQIDDQAWEALPVKLRRAAALSVLELISRDAENSIRRGGMDDPTTHMSRAFHSLDVRGCEELSKLLHETFHAARDIAEASMARSPDDCRTIEVAILGFTRVSEL